MERDTYIHNTHTETHTSVLRDHRQQSCAERVKKVGSLPDEVFRFSLARLSCYSFLSVFWFPLS